MITYTYSCRDCNIDFEIKQRITQEKLTKCIQCDGHNVCLLITSNTFLLKSKGWSDVGYATKPKQRDVGDV